MKRNILAILTVLITTATTYAQITKEEITSNFFIAYKKDPTTAYLNLFANNKWMADKKSVLETSKIKLNDLIEQLGEYQGYEFITEKQAGQSYIVKSFLVKYDRQPLRFTFVLYRPKDVWNLQNFTFEADFDTELTEAARIDRLKSNFE